MNFVVVTYECYSKTESNDLEYECWNVRGIFSESDGALSVMRDIKIAESEKKRKKCVSLNGAIYKCVLAVPFNQAIDLRLMGYGFPLSVHTNSPVMRGISVLAEELSYKEPPNKANESNESKKTKKESL